MKLKKIIVVLLTMMMLIGMIPATALADDSGFISASGYNDDNGVSNEARAYSSNNSYVEFNMSSDRVDYIFGSGIVPAGVTITGIEVKVEAKKSSRASKTFDVSLYAGGTKRGNTKNTGALTTSDAAYTLGGSLDTWGYSSWTDTEINSNFQVRIQSTSDYTLRKIYLDNIQVKVFYTPVDTDDVTITFDFGELSSQPDDEQGYDFGDTVTAPTPDPGQIEGGTFREWSPSVPATASSGMPTLYTALYDKNSYTVSYYEQDGTTLINDETVLFDEVATPPSPAVISGMTHIGWTLTGDDTGYADDLNHVKENLMAVAKYEGQAAQLTVQTNLSGAGLFNYGINDGDTHGEGAEGYPYVIQYRDFQDSSPNENLKVGDFVRIYPYAYPDYDYKYEEDLYIDVEITETDQVYIVEYETVAPRVYNLGADGIVEFPMYCSGGHLLHESGGYRGDSLSGAIDVYTAPIDPDDILPPGTVNLELNTYVYDGDANSSGNQLRRLAIAVYEGGPYGTGTFIGFVDMVDHSIDIVDPRGTNRYLFDQDSSNNPKTIGVTYTYDMSGDDVELFFEFWDTASMGHSYNDPDGALTVYGGSEFNIVEEDVFEVNFYSGSGGSFAPGTHPTTQEIIDGHSVVNVPVINEYPAHTHTGWQVYDVNAGSVIGTIGVNDVTSYVIDRPINFTATYNEELFTIEFLIGPEGSTYDTTLFTNLHYGQPFPTIPTVTSVTHDFIGWLPSLDPIPSEVTGNGFYTAQFAPKVYTVTFETTGGGTIDGGTTDITHPGLSGGSDCPTPPATSAGSGYHFLGWTKNGGSTYYTSSEVDAMTISADTTFTAHYEEDLDFRVHNSNGPGGDHGFMRVTYNGTVVDLDAGDTYTFVYYSTGGNIRVDFIPDTSWAFEYFVIDDPASHTSDNPAYFDPSGYAGQPGANNQLSINPKWSTSQTFTITWENYDGTQLEEDLNVPYGATPSYDGSTPTKPSTAQYDYTFAGWAPTVSSVTGDQTYVAQFTPELRDYTITWENYDGTQLEQDLNVPYGTTPTYNSITPTKPANAQYTYTFNGWSPAIHSVDGDETYTAQFTSHLRSYPITWENWNGGLLEFDSSVPYGTMPSYNGSTPTKPSTAQYDYTFIGWAPTVHLVTGAETYTAQFDPVLRSYTITWENHDGTQLEQDLNVVYGDMPSYDGSQPTKPSTAQYDYTFIGWAPTVSSVTGDETYVAQFTPELRDYTITWENYDGTQLEQDLNVPYGDTPSYDGSQPTKPSTAQYDYTFSGWSPAISSVTGDQTYVAQFTPELRSYTITWENHDGTQLEQDLNVPYGDMPSYDGSEPTKPSTAQYDYTFSGWFPVISSVTGNETYTAQFTPELRDYTITWENYDGTQLEQDLNVPYGDTPSYDGSEPTKPSTPEFDYTFVGWLPVVHSVDGDETYVAQFESERRSYRLIFHDGHSGEISNNMVVNGTPISYPTDPTRGGYNFTGWDSNPVNMPAHDLTITATWSDPIEYDITYIMDGGTNDPANPDTYTVENAEIVLEDPTKPGYNFTGWTPTDTIPAGSTGNKTFTATWSDPIEYDITYIMNGGTNDPANPDTYTVEDVEIVLEDPTKTGYNFTGWTPTDTIPAGSTGNKTFTATWSDPIEYDITYIMDGGTNDPANPDTYTVEDVEIVLEDPTKPGYNFTGWTPTDTIPAGSTGNKTFTATWSDPIEYDITYIMDGGTNDPANPDTYTVENAEIVLEDPTKPGYNFTGWTPTDTIPAGSTGNKTFTATWSDPIEYDITYIMDGGTNDPANPDTYTVEDAEIVLEDPTKPGYNFTGWTPTDTIPAGSTGNKTFTATWSDPIEYDITYIMDGGTNDSANPDTYTVEDAEIVLEDPTKPGYNFTGWTPTDTIPAGSTGNKTFTATWSDPIEYDITYIMNGGTNDPANPDTYTVEDAEIVLEDPAKPGYNFTGWTPTDTIPAGSTGNKTFTATWSDPIEYTIDYDLDGGSVAGTNPVTYTVETADITLINPTKAGYNFTGWTGTGLVSPTMTVVIPQGSTGNRSYTATWSDPIEYTITYIMNGGTNDPANPDTYTVESAEIVLADPARLNHQFTGWTPTDTIPAGSTGDKEFEAGWVLNTYTVTFVDHDGTVLGTDTVAHGSDATPPADPEREGHDFMGWAPDYTNVTGDLTVEAQYEIIVYPVTFVDHDGTVLGTDNVPHGSDATPPSDPEREGHTFTGWSPDYTNVTGALAVEARYDINVHTVTFVDHDGTVIDEQQIEHGSDAKAPNDPTRENFKFKGWDTPFDNVTSDLTVKALYTETIDDEEIPKAGPQSNDWLWWLMLIPGTGLLLIILAFWLKVVPVAEQVTQNPDGTFTIQWGYENRKGRKVKFEEDDSILTALEGSILSSTLIEPDEDEVAVPPVKFQKGRVENVLHTVISPDAKVEWKIRNRKAVADPTKEQK